MRQGLDGLIYLVTQSEDGGLFMTALILSNSDSDRPIAGAVSFILVHEKLVTIRYISAIADNLVAGTLRVVIGTRILGVVGVQNLHDDMKTEGKAYQTLLCVEGEAA